MSPWRQRAGRAFLALWVPAVVVVFGLLMVNHTVAMPSPTRLDRIEHALLRDADPGTDHVVHVIFADCSCTDLLVDHLAARGPEPGRVEVVWFVGPKKPRHAALSAAGFPLVTLHADDLAERLDLRAAPVLLAVHDGALAYAGGYFGTPAAVRPLDVGLLDAVARGERPDPLPVFGCAMDPALQG
jgi:hypothetical protein